MKKRFALDLDEELHNDFFRLSPDHGSRTALVRRFIRTFVSLSKVQGELTSKDVINVAEKIHERWKR